MLKAALRYAFWGLLLQLLLPANTFTCLLWDERDFEELLPENFKVSILGSDKLVLHNMILIS